ncbi:50S ribosomal protein L30, partial [Enterococcus hirae]
MSAAITPSGTRKRAGKKAGKKLTVRQVRSGTGFDRRQKATLKALGLSRIGRTREHPDNPQIRGMISKISHLVVVEEQGKG